MMEDSLSIENEERIGENEENEKLRSLGNLPDVVLQHLAAVTSWSSRRILSQLDSRFYSHFAPLLKEAKSMSIKGQVSVGVGNDEMSRVHSYLSEFYTIHVEMDDEMFVDWTMKLESGMRTVVHRQYDGRVETKTTRSVLSSSRDYLEKVVKWLLQKFQFKKIHLGVHGLHSLFDSYNHQVDEVGVSDEIEYLALAERLSPKKLALFQPTQNHHRRGELDLKKFPQLEELRLYGVPLDLDQFIESNLLKVTADTISKEIKLEHANKMIERWKRGISNYKNIRINSEPSRIPIRVPYQQWSNLQNENDSFYDDIQNNRHKIGSFKYSPKCFEFVAWDENGGLEPSIY